MPEIARAITSRWISEVPSKMGCTTDGHPLSIWQIYANGAYNYTPYP